MSKLSFTTAFKLSSVVAAVALLATPVFAQNFPTKTIRIIVPYGASSIVDAAPRILAQKMAADLGQSVVVDNKSGGAGIPAINDILNQPADGHTILAADASHWATTPAMQTVPYDFMRDFTPISVTFSNGLIFVTGPNSGINSFQDLIAAAKAKPGALNFSTPGIGSAHQLSFEYLKANLGIDMKHIPYRGAAEMIEAVMRNDAQVTVSSPSSVLPLAKTGRLKMIAVNIPQRMKQVPDVPTVAELTGLKDFDFAGRQGFVIKAGAPKATIDRLAASVYKAASAPDVVKQINETFGADMVPTTPDQFSQIIRADIVKFTQAVKLSGAKPS